MNFGCSCTKYLPFLGYKYTVLWLSYILLWLIRSRVERKNICESRSSKQKAKYHSEPTLIQLHNAVSETSLCLMALHIFICISLQLNSEPVHDSSPPLKERVTSGVHKSTKIGPRCRIIHQKEKGLFLFLGNSLYPFLDPPPHHHLN